MSADLKAAVALARKLKEEAPKSFVAPPVGTRPANEYLLPFALVRGTRGYVEKVVNQVNGCYEKGWFDGCAVMMRRLVETLIIECFEHHHIDHKIKNVKGDFLRTFLSFCCKRVQVMEGERFIISDKWEGTESVVEGFSPKNPDLPWRRPRCNIAKFVLV